jgi:hypothetical protein
VIFSCGKKGEIMAEEILKGKKAPQQAIIKRIADAFEKFAVTSFAFGLFWDIFSFGIIGILSLCLSLFLTYYTAR